MKTLQFCMLTIIMLIANTNYSMNKKHSVRDNYKIGRTELFESIKKYDVETCKNLFEKYKDLAHTQCEIEYERGETHYFPIWYLLSLDSENTNTIDSFISITDIAKLIIQNITDIKWLYNNIYFTLEKNYATNKIAVSETTIQIFEKLFERENEIFTDAKNSKNQEEIKKMYAISQKHQL